MKKEITNDMIQGCYKQAVAYINEKIGIMDAADKVAEQTGMNRNSAQRTIHSIIRMLSGECYVSIINQSGVRLIFDNIKRDYGNNGLKYAIKSTREHVEYYKTKQANLTGTTAICDEYESKMV